MSVDGIQNCRIVMGIYATCKTNGMMINLNLKKLRDVIASYLSQL